jgi:hypothetical protein
MGAARHMTQSAAANTTSPQASVVEPSGHDEGISVAKPRKLHVVPKKEPEHSDENTGARPKNPSPRDMRVRPETAFRATM